ncbi:MAG: divalent-cation tolerance protein CutA [Novosphingobium sp.]
MSIPGAALIWCPFPDETSAATAARTLLDERLVACANLLPGVRSLYLWQGERGEAREVVAVFKTAAALLTAAVERLATLHPYDTPAIAGWRCDAAAEATLDWLAGLDGGPSGFKV